MQTYSNAIRTCSWRLRGAITAAVVIGLLPAASAEQYVRIGGTSLFSGTNQPYVDIQIRSGDDVFGPQAERSRFLLDTGATSILAVGAAAADLHQSGGDFDQGEFLEQGVGGFVPYRVSAPYSIDVSGLNTAHNDHVRILSDPHGSLAGGLIQGIVGMPSMVNRVTSLSVGVSTFGGGTDLDSLFGGLLGGTGGLGGIDLEGLEDLLGPVETPGVDPFGGLGGLGGLLGGLGGLFGGDLLLGGGANDIDDLLGGLNGGSLGLGGLGDIDLLLGDDIFASLGLPVLDQGLLDLNDVLGNGGLDISSLSDMEISFADSLPPSNGHRYAVPVRPMRFDPENDTVAPSTAPLPALRVEHQNGEQTSVGRNYVFDTGAQMSIISTETARELGLDLSRPEMSLPVAGVGDAIAGDVFTIDRLQIETSDNVDLVWEDVQVMVLDIDPSIDGVVGSDLINAGGSGDDLLGLSPGGSKSIEMVHFDFRQLDLPNGEGTIYFDLDSEIDVVQGTIDLKPGDANQDLQFDQLDLVQVLQRAKYLTGLTATWGDGDWDGAPGGTQGSPPSGDGVFNQLDIVASMQSGGYSPSAGAALGQGGVTDDDRTSIVYDATTGEVRIDAPIGHELTSINIDSAEGIFTGSSADHLDGAFDNDADNNLFKATFGGAFGSISLGAVAETGLAEEFVLGDLSVIGSLAGGGDLGTVDLVYLPIPEPSTAILSAVAILSACLLLRPQRRTMGQTRNSFREFLVVCQRLIFG